MKSRQDSLSETATCEKFQMGRELSSEVDFLKLTREPKVGQRTRQESEVEDRGLIGRKSSDRGTLSDQKSLRANSDSDVESRNGRQMLKRSNLIAKQVISKASALSMGFVSQLWVDTSSVGDVILVEDENVLENEPTMVGLDSLGLWEPPNMHAQEWNDVMVRKSSPRSKEFEGLNRKDYEIERELNLLSEKHMPYKSTAKKAPVNVSEFKDEWSLPMDY